LITIIIINGNSAQWGYQPGGWGEAPVDEYGQPLYGDVFGTDYTDVPEEVNIYSIYIYISIKKKKINKN